jgi:hypothetical protein
MATSNMPNSDLVGLVVPEILIGQCLHWTLVDQQGQTALWVQVDQYHQVDL